MKYVFGIIILICNNCYGQYKVGDTIRCEQLRGK